MNKQGIEKAIATVIDLKNKHWETDTYTVLNDTVLPILYQQLNNGWIPISERWPDKSGHYLVIYHEWTDGNYLPKYDEVYVKILRYHEAIFRLPVCVDKELEKDTHREVLAWQPLPERPKEVSHDRSNRVFTESKGNM